MGTRTADCRKFTPNIFNKSKCSHCFRQREEHSAAALECNRASRKVSKCGYLFVAPDWDFNNPLYRTKRWQRRWFVLYDDGELTYSVDEHPETVPQACIDMTKVLEVAPSEDVTGHSNSIAITAPDRVTFVKGTCPEESKWWLNILGAFPKSKGRHKRNATFPGGQTTTILQSSGPPNSRNRHNLYHKDTLTSQGVVGSLEVIGNTWDTGTHDSVVSSTGQDENNKNAGNELTNRVYADQPVSSKSPPTRDKIYPENKAQARIIRNRNRNTPSLQIQDDFEPASSCLLIEDAHRDEKLKDIANALTNLSQINTSRWSHSPPITPSSNNNNNCNQLTNQSSLDDQPTRDETDFHPTTSPSQDYRQVVNMRPKSLPLASSSAPAIVSAIVKKIPPVTSENKSSPRLKLRQQQLQLHKNNNQSHERGDPDGGCNLDELSSNYLSKTSELRVNLPAEDILNSKKGWLLKQDSRTKEWTKHWFSLRGAALFYYRDPVTEERGVLDGVLDVNSLTNISEISTASQNFAIQLTTWENRKIMLASVSANARTNWIIVLRHAAGLQTETDSKDVDEVDSSLIIKDNTSDDLKSEIEKDFIKAQRNQEIIINSLTIHESETESSPPAMTKPVPTPATPITQKTVLFSSDEEYRTASEGGRRDSVDWGSPLSPSPPLPLSIFRAKERIRSRSGSSPRLHKRSRSSPPSSRRSTVDSVGSDELPLIHPVQEEFNIDKELQIRLGAAEKERDMLREEAREREARMSELLTTLERTELELTARIREVEEARDNLQRQLTEANNRADKIIARLTNDLEQSQMKIKDLEDRLSRGIEENESLYKKLREMEGCSPTSFSNLNRSKMKRVDSLSDLTNLNEIDPYGLERDVLADEYNELKSRFEKAVNEIKAMKKELKESQNEFDSLEISYAALKQDVERKECEDRSQLQMMAERIQDLTLKYTASERQVRTLKQKLAKSERRRSSSLKGKEQLVIPKELEEKVSAMETKIEDLEMLDNIDRVERVRSDSDSPSKKLSSQPRRKSLESPGSTDSLQFMVRLSALEKRIENASLSKKTQNALIHNQSSPKISEHLVERLKCLEGVLISSKDRVEQSLHQLQSLRSTRTRRSVSPITDRKDSFRFVERCLTEVVKLIRESCETCIVGENSTSTGILLLPESNPIKLALLQLEAQLRSKLSDLLKQRRVLRERNELTSRKDLELLAERIAFESVCFGKLRDSIKRAENPSLFGEKQTKAEIAETSQLMSMLKAKLSGKCAFKPSGSLDILAGVLARRLVLSNHNPNNQQRVTELAPVDPKMIDELLRQQNEICLITKRYRNNAVETLAAGLAAETLSFISSNDAVQGAVQEAWRQAQETVNAELVQSEIANIMIKSAERFENSITPSFGYTLTREERISFENFSDAVHETLRKEMEGAIEQLTRTYEDCLQKMKRGQWRLHLEQERKASEGRQMLVEFADIVAHKALVDARIAVLKGDYISRNSSSDQKLNFSIATLQKYENLFEELSSDLQICNPDDILTEADFNYMYKNHTIEFLSDKPQLREISVALARLEESVILLHRTMNPNNSITSNYFEMENLNDVCQKCQELTQRIDNIIGCAQKLTSPCEQCEKMQDSICNLTTQHETELRNLEQVHANDITTLKQQIEDQINTIKNLEDEKNSLIEELHLQSNLVEDHEKELAAITLKLKNKEEECHRKDNENLDITERLEDQENQLKSVKKENENLSSKCIRQDEEYAALLQERDYIQAELNKERERSRKLEKRLEMLEIEHSKQLECLQEAYKDQILSHCTDFTGIADEESFRQRYQTEIEQLRTLCEKGLAAMESSHRRIIADLEEKHRKEIDRLLTEKEQALAEETQATLAALDAMRKAHQSEVQREVARFKQEFLKQFQKGEQCIDPVREKEEELEELRQEILSFSEKYSIKCVENAALEERLRAANQKLRQFQQMQQLELRNKQFRAHLASEDPSDLNFVQGLMSKEDSPCPDSEHDRNEVHEKLEQTNAKTQQNNETAENSQTNDTMAKLLGREDLRSEKLSQSEFNNQGMKLNQVCKNVTIDNDQLNSKMIESNGQFSTAETMTELSQNEIDNSLALTITSSVTKTLSTTNTNANSNDTSSTSNIIDYDEPNRINRNNSNNSNNSSNNSNNKINIDNNTFNTIDKIPVHEPKISKNYTPKNVNNNNINININNNSNHNDKNLSMKLVNLDCNNETDKNIRNHYHHEENDQQQNQIRNDNNNYQNHHIHNHQQQNQQHQQNSPNEINNQSNDKLAELQITFENRPNRNEVIKKRLAVSLSSLSELLNNNTNCMKNHNNNNNNSNNIGNNYTSTKKLNIIKQRYNQNSPPFEIPKQSSSTTNSISDRNVFIDHSKLINGDKDCRYQQQQQSYFGSTTSIVGAKYHQQYDSTATSTATPSIPTTITTKKCSPPPLSGRDVEHHTTSHLRRFELEI